MLVEEKEETKPADSKLAIGKEKQMNKTKTNKNSQTTSNMALLYISGFAIHMTLSPKIGQFLILFPSIILYDSLKANITSEVPLLIH